MVLLDFTGSDWCRRAWSLKRKFSRNRIFQTYAKDNLVFLSVNFPLKAAPEANANE